MNRCNLMLHAGANHVSREQVGAVPVPPRTATWVPIAHDRLLNGVQSTLERTGFQVLSEAHGLTRDGARYFGLLQIANGHNADDFGRWSDCGTVMTKAFRLV